MTEHDLLDALELGNLALPWLPGRADPLPVPGVLGRVTPIDSFFVNQVSMTRLTEADADTVLPAVIRLYRDRGLRFSWITGPRSRPVNLVERLVRAGFTRHTGYAGLALTDLDRPIEAPIDVEILAIDASHIDALDHVKSVAFDMPLAAAHWIDELLLHGLGGTVRAYLARRRGESTWSAFGQCWMAPHAPIVILGGGGVLPEARGKGLFRALVRRRIADARAGGAEAATMQAMDATSAPIMKRLGFDERAQMDMWLSPE